MKCQNFTCVVTLIQNAWELAPYFFQNPLPSGIGHTKAFLNGNKNEKNNFCMSRTNARYPSELISPIGTVRGNDNFSAYTKIVKLHHILGIPLVSTNIGDKSFIPSGSCALNPEKNKST